jgi:cell division protein FtsB
MITLKNNSKATYIHGDFKLLPGEVIAVPSDIASIWLLIPGVIEYKDPAEAKAEKEELEKKNKALKKEIEELKKQSVSKITTKPKSNKKAK